MPKRFYVLLCITVASFIIMTWLSHQNGEHTAQTSMNLARWLSFINPDTEAVNAWLRRYAHVYLFSIMTKLILMTLSAGGIHPLVGVPFLYVLAWIDEVTKPFIQGRHYHLEDVKLNMAGVTIGCVLFFGFTAIIYLIRIRISNRK